MQTKEIREIIIKALPAILKHDKKMQKFIVNLSKAHFADKKKTEDRFDKILRELAEDREEQAKKWEGQERRWEESKAESDKKWEESNRKWEENQKVINKMLTDIDNLIKRDDEIMKRFESSIGALGSRWGLRSEQSFRNALKGILGEVSGMEVVNVVEYDDKGEVFGYPDQIEIDVIIKNGLLMLCEIKSSMSKADIYIFHKKAELYQRMHNRKANRLLVISPMVEKKALDLAMNWGIQVYSYVEDIAPDLFSTSQDNPTIES